MVVNIQVRKLFNHENFERTMKDLDLAAWASFKKFSQTFYGNSKERRPQFGSKL